MYVSLCKHTGCHTLVKGDQFFCKKHADDLAGYQQRMSKMRVHDKRQVHEYNTKVRYATPERKRRESFYHNKEWKSIRKVVLERDNYICQYCHRYRIVKPANIVDHIVPGQVAPDLITDMDNLVTCCYKCHQRKTEWEQSFYGTGYTDGKKLKTDILIKNIAELPNFSK